MHSLVKSPLKFKFIHRNLNPKSAPTDLIDDNKALRNKLNPVLWKQLLNDNGSFEHYQRELWALLARRSSRSSWHEFNLRPDFLVSECSDSMNSLQNVLIIFFIMVLVGVDFFRRSFGFCTWMEALEAVVKISSALFYVESGDNKIFEEKTRNRKWQQAESGW